MSVAAVMPLSDGHLAYDVRGPTDGPSLLLLRPAGGSMELWGRFREILAEQLRVVSFDPRGQGRSSGAPLWWSVDDMVEDAIQLLELLVIDRTHVFGISLGGMVALRLAIAHPERLDHLVVASTVDGSVPTMRSALAGARLAGCLTKRNGDLQACAVDRTTARPNEEARRRAKRVRPARRSLLSYGVAALRHDVREDLDRVTAPTLVLAGRRDPLTPPRVARSLARRIPGARLRLIDAGHDLTVERPLAAARAVLSFVLDEPERLDPPLELSREALP